MNASDGNAPDTEADGETGTETEPQTVGTEREAASLRVNWWLIGGGALVVLALMLGSAAGGWWLASRSIASSMASQEEDAESPVLLADESAMPDVRGLTRDEAAQVLADSGFSAAIVTFEDTPSAAPEGIVVTQFPVFGTASPTAITLGVAVPTSMPDLTGRQRDAAVTALSDLGVAVTVEFTYFPHSIVGTVVGAEPAAGKPLGESALVRVATTGASASLDELDRISGRCHGAGEVSLGGEEFTSSIECDTPDPEPTVWMLRGKTDRFTATVGIDDTATPGSQATVEILADGVVVATEQVVFGKPVEIDVPTPGIIQLAVRTSAAAESGVVLAGAVVHGTDEAIAEILR